MKHATASRGKSVRVPIKVKPPAAPAIKEYKRFVAAFDLHGDKLDPGTVTALGKFSADWKPDIRIFGGDLWDFRPLRGKASEEERRESMAGDYVAGRNWLLDFAPHFYLRGNHCQRLWDLADKDKGIESDYALNVIGEVEGIVGKLGCRMLPYHKRDGVLKIGHLKVIHGFHCGVFAVRQTALIYGSCLMGHIHAIDEHAIPGLERRVARACGCLCSLDMEYAARNPTSLRQANGWAYGVVNERTGNYFTWQAESIDGNWILPSDIISL
jgi:hypothetical protein